MEIEVRLFATFRQYLPQNAGQFAFLKDMNEGATVAELLQELRLPDDIPKLIIVSAIRVSEDHILHHGDVVNIFPPVAGG